MWGGQSGDGAPSRSEVDDEEQVRAVEIGQQANCIPILDELMYCYSPANQVSTFYYTGMVDPCQVVQKNFFKCLSLKLNKPADEKQRILNEITFQEHQSPSSTVWTFRQDPASDWLTTAKSGTPEPELSP